jgi:tetratricopeptide (TPR) repeat protein
MLGALLLVALAQAPQAPQAPVLDVRLDREQLEVGEEAELVLEFAGGSDEPAEFDLPDLPLGLQVLGRSERTSVSFAPTRSRTTTLVLTLRAVRPGTWTYGPFEVRQGSRFASAPPVSIEVTGGGTSRSVQVNPVVREMLERAPPPARPGDVALTLLLSSRRVRAGEQVDLVTAAWFPRDLRLQLRRPPTLQQPKIEGVWVYPQPVPVGIATSRRVRGEWYDLFITHQVVFPVSPGEIRIAPAELQYGVPVAYQFFSREERFTVTSDAATLRVDPLPTADGRPFGGPVGRGFTLGRTIRPSTAAVGEPVTVSFTLRGAGNVALWPAPQPEWPAGGRVYDDGSEERVGLERGQVAGTKSFRFLLVPDSVGALVLPPLRMRVFDLDRDEVATVSVPALALTVNPGGVASSQRGLPPPVRRLGGAAPAWRVTHGLPAWLIVGLLVLAPLLPFARRVRFRRPRVRAERRAKPGSLAEAEHRLHRALAAFVPGLDVAEDADVRLALELAGLDTALADRAVRLRAALRVARFGPRGVEEPGLAHAAEAAAAELGEGARQRRRRRGTVGAAALALLVAGAALAQGRDATRRYEAGDLVAAAEAFAGQASREPGTAAHWYNLGAARYRLGEDAAAAAAWRTALRLEPRATDVRRALDLVPPSGPESARELWTAPVTPDELLLLGLVCWLAGWATLAITRRARLRRVGWAALAIGGACLAGSTGLRWWYDRPLVLVRHGEPARVSPTGLAREVARLEAGAALERRESAGSWTLVASRRSPVGWVRTDALVPVPGYIFRWSAPRP